MITHLTPNDVISTSHNTTIYVKYYYCTINIGNNLLYFKKYIDINSYIYIYIYIYINSNNKYLNMHQSL